MNFLKRILQVFSAKAGGHPKFVSFNLLSKEERVGVLKSEAKEFSKKYGELIKTLANE